MTSIEVQHREVGNLGKVYAVKHPAVASDISMPHRGTMAYRAFT